MNGPVGLKVLNVGDILSVNPYDATVGVRDSDPSHLASRVPKQNTRDENRTRKAIGRGILSPVRLPVPPPGREINVVHGALSYESSRVASR